MLLGKYAFWIFCCLYHGLRIHATSDWTTQQNVCTDTKCPTSTDGHSNSDFIGRYSFPTTSIKTVECASKEAMATMEKARQLESKGYKELTLKEIINKMKKLRQKYKEEKDKTKKSGNGTGKKWKFFDEIDAFLMRKHNVTPPCLVDTMTEVQNQSDESAEDGPSIVDVLIERYGGGETSVHKCATCDYEQEIRSEGVHVSDGGCIQVFSADDQFSCPNCDANQSSHEAALCGTKNWKSKGLQKSMILE